MVSNPVIAVASHGIETLPVAEDEHEVPPFRHNIPLQRKESRDVGPCAGGYDGIILCRASSIGNMPQVFREIS